VASDIKLNDNAVIVDGNVGIGTNTPIRKLHVEGSEVHSGGPVSGFSFADRTQGNAQRWVWYAQDIQARLFSQAAAGDLLRVSAIGGFEMNGSVTIHGSGSFGIGPLPPALKADTGEVHSGGHGSGFSFADRTHQTYVPNPQQGERWAWYALDGQARLWSGSDRLSIHPKNGVRIEGNLQVTGTVTQASSIALKDNVAALSGPEALATLQGLQAVKYTYKADDTQQQRLGFIAEDVPDLVATAERDRLSPMDLIAVLTTALQEQQQTIAALAAEVDALKEQRGGGQA
jgi:Chaperone of endosialidase